MNRQPETRMQMTPYEGTEDYIFVSYSHQDMDLVLPVLWHLQRAGVRFWYDEGIDPGSEWPESIARHLNGCRGCLAFISPNSLDSPNCRREVNFALSKNKEFLSVILSPVEMSLGMEMQISSYQSIMKYGYQSDGQFLDKLMSVELITNCRSAQPPEGQAEGAAGMEAPPAWNSGTLSGGQRAPAAAPPAGAPQPSKPGLPVKALAIGGGVVAAAVLLIVGLALVVFGGSSADPGAADLSGMGTGDDSSSEQSGVSQPGGVLMSDILYETQDVGYDEFYEQDHPVFGSGYLRRQISSVTFLDTLEEVPDDAWDVSEEGDGSVMAWVEPNGSLFDLYIGAEGAISAPADCSYLFAGYEYTESINFNGVFDTAGMTSAGYMFWDCSSLEALDVSGFDTANVTDMIAMFARCGGIASLDVRGFDTAKVTSMQGMFSDCTSLREVDVSGFDTARVTKMGWMFCNCKSLETLDVSGFDTANVTSMTSIFYGCNSLEALDVSGFDTSNITSMYCMFYWCSSLKTLDVSGFDTSKVTSMRSAFGGCGNLMEVDVSGFDTAKVTTMQSMFSDCTSLREVDVSGFDTAKVTNMHAMFYDCNLIKELNVSGFDTSNVTDMSRMFGKCSNLKTLNVSAFDTSNVTNMNRMFYMCSGMKELDLSGFDTAKVTDMSQMFGGCGNMASLRVKNWNTSGTETSDMFKNCSLPQEAVDAILSGETVST